MITVKKMFANLSVRITSLILITACILPLFTACHRDVNENHPSDTGESDIISEKIYKISDFTIVYPTYYSDVEEKAVLLLRDALESVSGIRPETAADYEQADSSRPEIILGNCDRDITEKSLNGLGELRFRITSEGDKIGIVGSSPDILLYAVKYFLRNYAGYSSETKFVTSDSFSLKEGETVDMSYIVSLPGSRISTYSYGNNPSYARPDKDITYDQSANIESDAGYTGETLTVRLNDPKYGGPQFVSKLFTEGLSRAPSGDEYSEYINEIEKEGCTAKLLGNLAVRLFSTDEYLALGFDSRRNAFAVYRAVLSRDPTVDEVNSFTGSAAENARRLTETVEFSEMLPGIISGAYFWGVNNSTSYTSDKIYTSAEINSKLRAGKDVVLEPGALVIMTAEISVPSGCTLRVDGDPTHYLNMARLLRTGSNSFAMINISDDSCVSGIFVDGNLSAYPIDSPPDGTNVILSGNACTIVQSRVSDSVCHQNIWALDRTEHHYIAHNLITGYASDHNVLWQDGISCLGTDTLIEYNDVVDLTDGAIVLFRFVSPNSIRAQNSIVRYNRVLNAGNSAYAGFDTETDNITQNPVNMTGAVIYDNEIWSSMRAHFHLMFTFSTAPWQADLTDRGFGNSFYNNSTPLGCTACCACAVAIDKVTDATLRGNHLELYIGEWCRRSELLRSRIFSVNSSNSSGNFQPGYEDLPTFDSSNVQFIINLQGGLTLETAQLITLRRAYLREAKQTIPASAFVSLP